MGNLAAARVSHLLWSPSRWLSIGKPTEANGPLFRQYEVHSEPVDPNEPVAATRAIRLQYQGDGPNRCPAPGV
jgi:hypothetical protein